MDIVIRIISNRGSEWVDVIRKMNFLPRENDTITYKENQYNVISVNFDFDNNTIYLTVK